MLLMLLLLLLCYCNGDCSTTVTHIWKQYCYIVCALLCFCCYCYCLWITCGVVLEGGRRWHRSRWRWTRPATCKQDSPAPPPPPPLQDSPAPPAARQPRTKIDGEVPPLFLIPPPSPPSLCFDGNALQEAALWPQYPPSSPSLLTSRHPR